jgi:hypothetical protein
MAAFVRRVCNERGGFEPAIHHHTKELTALLALVAEGHAITLLPEIAARGQDASQQLPGAQWAASGITDTGPKPAGASWRPATTGHVRAAPMSSTASIPSTTWSSS